MLRSVSFTQLPLAQRRPTLGTSALVVLDHDPTGRTSHDSRPLSSQRPLARRPRGSPLVSARIYPRTRVVTRCAVPWRLRRPAAPRLGVRPKRVLEGSDHGRVAVSMYRALRGSPAPQCEEALRGI